MTDNKTKVDNVLTKAAKFAGQEIDQKIKEEQAALDKKIKEYNTKEAAQKIVDSSLKKIIDDAVKRAKIDKVAKSDAELKQYIKDIVRGHKNAFFNAEALIGSAVKDTKKQLDYMIDKQVNDAINTKFLDQVMRPLNVALHQQIDLKINTKITDTIRLDITKQLDSVIGGMLKDPMKDAKVTLNKLHLNELSKELNRQVSSIQKSISTSITKGISSNIAAEQNKIAAVQKQIVEVQKQVMAFEQKLKDQVKALQDQVNAKLKEAENKLVDEIKKSIKIKL
jgi:hypothetical protein